MSKTRYLMVILPRTQAVVAVDIESKIASAIYCLNSEFCNRFMGNICPPYCQVIVEAKNFAFARKPRAEVYEIEEKEALKVVESYAFGA
jgi:hypothetical protein